MVAVPPPGDGPGDGLPERALAHAEALYRLARHLDREAAEDLVQETFARALRAADRFAPGTDLKAWLFRILRNAHLDRHRQAARHPSDGAGELAELEAGTGAWLRDDAELERLRGLVGVEIEAALSRLPDEARTAVLLDLEGFTESEMAAILGCPAGTVKSRLSRARAALRRSLSDYARGGRP